MSITEITFNGLTMILLIISLMLSVHIVELIRKSSKIAIAAAANAVSVYAETLIEVIAANNTNVGDIVETLGFYTKGDGGAAKYQVQSLSGNEVWQDTGYGWQLSRNAEIKYYTNKKLIFIGSIVSSKKMGCKADGVSDDSVILKTIFKLDKQIIIDEGVHIFNITPTANHKGRFFVYQAKATTIRGTKGKSILKLGEGNCDERIYTGFWALFAYLDVSGNSIDPDIDILWEGITIDFNPASNPLYHSDSRFNTIDVNKQNIAISINGGRDFIVRDCTFTGHCGANVIWYRLNQHNTREAKITIEHNVFEDIGQESGIGCHDHSTLYIHNPRIDTLPDCKCKLYIGNNIFKASYLGAPNAYNAIETGCSGIIENNIICGYWQGILPFTEDTDVVLIIQSNIMREVLSGVLIWATQVTSMPSIIDLPAYDKITISGNYQYTPVKSFKMKHPYYEDNPNQNVYSPNGVGLYTSFARDIGNLEIVNNTIHFDYEDLTGVPNCSNIDLRSSFSTGTQTRTTIPTLGTTIIKGNVLRNAPSLAIDIASYAKLDSIEIAENIIENSNWMLDAHYPRVIYVQPVTNGNFTPEAHEIRILNNTFNNCAARQILTYNKVLPRTREANITIAGNIEQGVSNFNDLGWFDNINNLNITHNRPYAFSDDIFHQIRTDGTFGSKVANQNIFIRFTDGMYDHGKLTVRGVVPSTNGIRKIGDRIENTNLATGYVGWVCTVSGTPGTWKGYGLLQS